MRIDPPVSVPVVKGTIPAASAAAEPPLDPPATRSVSAGISHGAEVRIVGGHAVGQLVQAGLADGDRARFVQAGDNVRIAIRNEIGEELGAPRRADALGEEAVLVGDGNAVQRASIDSLRKLAIQLGCSLKRRFFSNRDERVQTRGRSSEPHVSDCCASSTGRILCVCGARPRFPRWSLGFAPGQCVNRDRRIESSPAAERLWRRLLRERAGPRLGRGAFQSVIPLPIYN